MNKNFFTHTDVYKIGHRTFYPEGTTKVFAYLLARSDKKFPHSVFWGLQGMIKEYLQMPISKGDVDEFMEITDSILGPGVIDRQAYDDLVQLGYLPIEIKAVPEGSVVPNRNVLMTVTNTHPDFYWVVGFVESLLLKLWNTSTVATNSYTLQQVCKAYSDVTCDNEGHLPFQIHDFGYRGCSSEETSALSGASHLLSFLGTDTVPAVKYIRDYYGIDKDEPIGLSVPATEHSVMCSYGKDNELEAFKAILKKFPTGIVSIVSDTYDYWDVLTNKVKVLKDEILARDGKVVFRPDSGNPVDIILGTSRTTNPDNWQHETPESLGSIKLLWQEFGGSVNEKGYKILNPKVGLIYGDGITPERMQEILQGLKEMKFASSNIVFGIGGLLLQNFNRDTLGFAQKATYVEVDGDKRAIQKDPVTDPGKKSHTGLIQLIKKPDGQFTTIDNCTPEEEAGGYLQTVFKDGKLLIETNFSEIRRRLKNDK